MLENSVQSTIYDDVWRTELCDMIELVIPVVNEVFGESFPLNARIEHLPDTHEFEDVSGRMERRTTDSCFRIYRDDGTDSTYHIECQSMDDTTMAIRMIEYDFAIAIENVQKEGRRYRMELPRSCVLYLRSGSNTPDFLEVEIVLYDESVLLYRVPTIKLETYTKDKIFEKGFSTKGEGRGIGLYHTKQLITSLGGRISVESEVGIGSCFMVNL